MIRLLFTSIILFAGVTWARTQTISASDGYVNTQRTGVTWTLLPVARGDTTVTPYSEWDGWWSIPMVFSIAAQPHEEFVVTFSISGNINSCNEEIPVSFAGDALWWEEEGRYLDPGTPQRVAMDSAGKATLGLGMTFTLPPGTESPLSEILVHCRIVNTLTGDTTTSSSICGLELYTDLEINTAELQVRNLRRGQTYTVHPGPDTFFVTPVGAGGETAGMDPFRIRAIPGSDVLISFSLPTEFRQEDELGRSLGRFPCRFDTNALYIEEGDQWLDPNIDPSVHLGPGCVSDLRMGVTMDIPADAAPGWYIGEVILSLSYIGKSMAGPAHPLPSEEVIFIAVQVLGDEVPDVYSLSQNYPNPFNSTTTISYALPEESPVSLEIYDPLGRKIRTLVDGIREAGIHSEIFDAGGLPSGVYMYRLSAGNYRDMRKLLLIR